MQGFLSPIKTIDISPESTPVIGVVNQLKWLWGLYLQLNWIYRYILHSNIPSEAVIEFAPIPTSKMS
jgi:hypothetical protein